MFLDGGALDNSPVEEVKKLGANKIITVRFEPKKITKKSNIMEIILKTIDVMGEEKSNQSLKNSDIVLTIPNQEETSLLKSNKIEEFFNYGYEITKEKIDTIKKTIN